MTGDEVRSQEFHEAFRGYHPGQVDQFLETIAAALDRDQPLAEILQTTHFDRALRGYRPADVDNLIERLKLET